MAAAPSPVAGSILGFGNPLLDISADVPMAVLDKYGVQLNNAVLAEEKHLPVYRELLDEHADTVALVAGGATQNSVRVAQWMLQEEGATAFVGCVGKDEYADKMRAAVTADGVKAHYLVDEATPTGTCACLIHKHERSLIANLSAANNYKDSHLDDATTASLLDKARLLYISGFFLTVSPEAVQRVGAHALEHKKTFVMNLAAPFISQFFDAPLTAALPFVDIVVGNESEALAFAEKQGYEDKSLAGIAARIAALPKKDESRPRTVIITHGDKETTLVVHGSEPATFDVPPVPESEMVDVNGAGDAFVGGLLSQLARGKPLEEGIRAGHYAAGVVIRTSGTSLAGKPSFE